MSLKSDSDGVVTQPGNPDEGAVWSVPASTESVAAPNAATSYVAGDAPMAQPGVGEPTAVHVALPAVQASAAPDPADVPNPFRSRRRWGGAIVVGLIGVAAAGTLGYFLYTTTGQRDAALHRVAATEATLTTTAATLTAVQQDLAAHNAIAAYASMYIANSGRTRVDYQKLVACTAFGPCRTAAQGALVDMQTFQSDRSAATPPGALASSDAMLRDALSAAISADQELISGLDTSNSNKIKDGFHKFNAAMLSMAKAETVLGAELK